MYFLSDEIPYLEISLTIKLSFCVTGTVIFFRMGFHWPPFNLIKHLHLHVISSTNQMGLLARGIFWPNSYWFVTVSFV